jgi:hypothetical protein
MKQQLQYTIDSNFPHQLKLFLPIVTKSEANMSEHWTKKRKRINAQKTEIFYSLVNVKIKTPCKITLIRTGGKKMDYDNLVSCFKYIRDAIAEIIHPGLAIGRADDDESIEWKYEQEIGFKRKGVLISVL